MTETLSSTEQQPTAPTSPDQQRPEAEVDLRALAREILVLLKQELRHDLERQGRGR